MEHVGVRACGPVPKRVSERWCPRQWGWRSALGAAAAGSSRCAEVLIAVVWAVVAVMAVVAVVVKAGRLPCVRAEGVAR